MRLLTSLLVVLLLAGCASQKDTNAMIAKSNTDRYEAFTQGMNASTSEGARLAMAMAFAGNMGMQNLYREKDWVDYLNAFAGVVNPWIPLFIANSWDAESSSSMSAGRDIYVGSTRADSDYNVNSAVQEHLFNGDNNSSSSSDQPFTSEHP